VLAVDINWSVIDKMTVATAITATGAKSKNTWPMLRSEYLTELAARVVEAAANRMA
jgi:hypothetical protein